MKSKIANVNVSYYINLDTLRAIERSVGVELIGEQSPPSLPLFSLQVGAGTRVPRTKRRK